MSNPFSNFVQNPQIKTYWQTLSDFLGGSNNLTFYPNSSLNMAKYQPYTAKSLKWSEYELVAKTNADIKACLTLWQATTGSAGWDVFCNLEKNAQIDLEIAQNIYNNLKNLIDIDQIRQKVVHNLGVFGNAFVYIDPVSNLPVVVGSDRVNIYLNSLGTGIEKVRLLNQNGLEVNLLGQTSEQIKQEKSLKKPRSSVPNLQKKLRTNLQPEPIPLENFEIDLQPGIDIFHIKDFSTKPVASPRIDSCYEQILTQLHIWQSNNQKFTRGLIDLTFLIPEKDSVAYFQAVSKDGKSTNAQEFVSRIKDFFAGSKKAGSTALLPGIKDIKELGKNNRDMQTLELEARTTEVVAKAFSLTPTDLGIGDNATYNNASVFSYSAYRKIGKPIEEQFERLVNHFILPKMGLKTSAQLFFFFNKANNPDDLNNQKFALEVFQKSLEYAGDNQHLKNQLFNELRDKLELEAIQSKFV
jgi:hypothetical protein